MSKDPFQPDDELLSAYIDGELTADELRAVEEWIASDPAAQALVEELRNVSSTVQSLPRTSVPAEWTARLARRLDDAAGTETSKQDAAAKHESNGQGGGIASLPIGRSRRGWWYSAAAIAAAVAVVMMLPQGMNDELAKNTNGLKAPATGAEVATRAEHDEVESLSAPADDVATDSSLDAMADNMPTSPEHMPEPAAEAFTPESTPELADFARVAPPSPAAATADALATANNAYLIVWCDVPPKTLRQREINNVLGDNGIVVDERTESWTAAAAPVRQQIELRNNYAGGFGGGLGGLATNGAVGRETTDGAGNRFAVPETRAARSAASLESRNQPTATDESVAEEPADRPETEGRELERDDTNSDDTDSDSVEIEGETILVDATADQIASCLAAMQNDPGNYASITVEPVNEHTLAEQLAERSLTLESTTRPEGLSFRGMFAERDENNSGLAETEPDANDQVAEQPTQNSLQQLKQMAKQFDRPQARRLERPETWYYYNTAPQGQQQAIRLPVSNEKDDKAMAKSKATSNNRKAELDELNRLVEQQQQVMPKKLIERPLQEQQPVQVLFVLRNSKLPIPTLSAGPPVAGEIAPAEASEAAPAPAAEAP